MIPKTILRELQDLLLKSKAPMARIAFDAEVNRSHLYAIRAGTSTPTLPMAERIFEVLGHKLVAEKIDEAVADGS